MSTDLQTEYTFDADEPPSEAVISALAANSGEDPTAMDPLYERIDLEALDAIVGPKMREGGSAADVTVEFYVDAVRVSVSPGWVRIYGFDETATARSTAGVGGS
jgi:hypothetical protein